MAKIGYKNIWFQVNNSINIQNFNDRKQKNASTGPDDSLVEGEYTNERQNIDLSWIADGVPEKVDALTEHDKSNEGHRY